MEIKLDKPDDRPWGFRLIGGADCEEPLTVVKVSEGSLAELAGLKIGDVIVKVNDISTSDLTHMQVHNVIQESGRTFLLAVESQQDLIEKERTNTENTSVEFEQKEETIANTTEKQLKTGLTETEFTSQAQLQNTIENSSSTTPDIAMHERKWSTFLQKPKNEKPKPKKTDNIEIKGEPYRVIIKKQKKKDKETPSNATAEEATNDKESVEETDTKIKSDVDVNPENNIDLENESENTELTEVDKEKTNEEAEGSEQQEQREENPEEEASKSEAAIAVETTQKPLTLEEQLAQVQKQLQELAQLPSTIQSTLDAVTKKLATIVNAAHQEQQQQEEHDEQEKTATENDISEEISLEEAVTNEEERDLKEDTEQQEEMVDFEVYLPETEPRREEPKEESTLGQIIEENEPEPEMPTEEELEMERIQREKFEKIQKELKCGRSLEQKPDFPLTPLERPIILPGGRRWSQPNDACPAIRNPKMTDEKIADTIETYSEVIAGQIKGLTIGTIFGRGPTKKREFTETKPIELLDNK